MKRYNILLLLSVMILTSCTVINRATEETQMTQTQVREFQTRMFDTNDVSLIMKSVLNVLQDDGFIVRNVVMEIGLLNGSKDIDLTNTRRSGSDAFWHSFLQGLSGNASPQEKRTYNKIQQIEVSVNVTEFGKQSKVRANFQAKIFDNTGNVVRVYAVDDMKFYQEFFSKVDKGVFLQKHGL
jgi:hypothetical protein